VSVPLGVVGDGEEVGVGGTSVGLSVEVAKGSAVEVATSGMDDASAWFISIDGIAALTAGGSDAGEHDELITISKVTAIKIADLPFPIKNLSFT
jgi:hypothetical protein